MRGSSGPGGGAAPGETAAEDALGGGASPNGASNGHGGLPLATLPEPAEPAGREEGPGSLADRVKRPQTLVSFAIAAFILVFFFRRLDLNFAEIWGKIRHANLAWYALAFVVFYGAFLLRAIRWGKMLSRVGIDRADGYRVPALPGMVEIFLLSWFANCVVPAKLGDAYRSWLLKRACGARFSTTLGTIFAERLTDLTVLFLAMVLSGLAVFHNRLSNLPGAATQTVLIGSALLAVALIGLAGMWLLRDTLIRLMPARISEQYARLHDAIFRSLHRPEQFFAISVFIWFGEGLRLYFVSRALSAHLSFETALFVALMGSLLTTLPITPAGLGVVEGATIAVLGLVGVGSATAGAVALLDRVVGYWSVIVVGLVLYLWRMKKDFGPEAEPSAVARVEEPVARA